MFYYRQCGFNAGFCKSLPAKFLIDHVRVYQDKTNSKQTVGCNPKEYPTRRFILAHEYRYKSEDDVHAIKPIVRGGGKCVEDNDCGGNRGFGKCVFYRCKCDNERIGPHCLVSTKVNIKNNNDYYFY